MPMNSFGQNQSMSHFVRIIIVRVIVTLFLAFSQVGLAATLETPENFTSELLGPIVEYIDDPSGQLSLEDAKQRPWKSLEGGSFSEGFTDHQYWFRIKIINTASLIQNYVLEIRHPFLDHLDVIYEKNNRIERTDRLGDQLPVNQRALKHSDFLSSFTLQQNEGVTLYIRVASESTLQLPITLWERDAYTQHNHHYSVVIGVLLGFLVAIATYHLAIYFSTFESAYIYFGMFVVGMLITVSCLSGIPGFFFWPEASSSADNALLVGLLSCSTFNCLFARKIVDSKERTPRIDRVMIGCAIVSVIGMLLMPVLPYTPLLKLAFITGPLSVVLAVSAYTMVSMQRYKPAYYALASGGVAGLGICITMFDKLGIIPSNQFNAYAVYVGVLLMSLVQAFALSYRIKVADDIQKQAQHDLLIAQQSLNFELDNMVRQRTEELEQANERLLELSTKDGLTGLHNRRYFDESLDREYRSAFRNKWPIGILILDIDHFKSINDTYGHPFGDICLRDTGNILINSVKRPHDVTARYGGEEFVVLLPNTDLEGTLHIAESIRNTIKKHVFEDDNQSVNLTVSIGALSEIPSSGSEASNAMERADQLLYHAKKSGRDRVHSNNTHSNST